MRQVETPKRMLDSEARLSGLDGKSARMVRWWSIWDEQTSQARMWVSSYPHVSIKLTGRVADEFTSTNECGACGCPCLIGFRARTSTSRLSPCSLHGSTRYRCAPKRWYTRGAPRYHRPSPPVTHAPPFVPWVGVAFAAYRNPHSRWLPKWTLPVLIGKLPFLRRTKKLPSADPMVFHVTIDTAENVYPTSSRPDRRQQSTTSSKMLQYDYCMWSNRQAGPKEDSEKTAWSRKEEERVTSEAIEQSWKGTPPVLKAVYLLLLGKSGDLVKANSGHLEKMLFAVERC